MSGHTHGGAHPIIIITSAPRTTTTTEQCIGAHTTTTITRCIAEGRTITTTAHRRIEDTTIIIMARPEARTIIIMVTDNVVV